MYTPERDLAVAGGDDDTRGGGGKTRKRDDSPKAAGSKRSRYTSVACNECKRRKIKCNGEQPCVRCGNLQLDCVYATSCCHSFKDSEEFRQMNAHIESLQQQVDSLFASMNALHAQHQRQGNGSMASPKGYHREISVGPIDPDLGLIDQRKHEQAVPGPTESSTYGPTSSAYDFDVAKQSLQSVGITEGEPRDESDRDPYRLRRREGPARPAVLESEPLHSMRKSEILRLCKVYEEEVGLLYPFLDIKRITRQVEVLFAIGESMGRIGAMHTSVARENIFDDDDSLILKTVIATALTVENNGQSPLGQIMFSNAHEALQDRGHFWKQASMSQLRLYVIMAQYHFQTGEEVLAYRLIGVSARLCFELGLHRQEALQRRFETVDERCWALRLFWCIYTLDRRWSFGTGMPFAINDSDIDPSLPEPDDGSPFLVAMVHNGRLCSKVWSSLSRGNPARDEVKRVETEYLDYLVRQWQSDLPPSMQYDQSDNTDNPRGIGRSQRRLRVVLRLRANMLRMAVYRPVMYSPAKIAENLDYARTAVSLAQNSIWILASLNATTDIYRTQQVVFNYFLVSALAVLFLAAAHAPVEFSAQVKDRFHQALDLVRDFSTKSDVSRRLWVTIENLKDIAPRLGIVDGAATDRSSSAAATAATAMAGLAARPAPRAEEAAVTTTAVLGRPAPPDDFGTVPAATSSPMNGQQMSFDLTQLFEAAGAHGGVADSAFANNGSAPSGSDSGAAADGPLVLDEGFARIMMELY